MSDDPGREMLEVVDERDRVTGLERRSVIHRQGLLHRSAHVFVLDKSGRIYLQFRSSTKDQYPLHWDTSTAGHVDPGESYANCASRELDEELGLVEDLNYVLRVEACAATGWEHVELYECATSDTPVPDPDEVADGRFYERTQVQALIDDPSFPTTPSLDLLFDLWRRSRPIAD